MNAAHLAGHRADSWVIEMAGERIEGLSRTYSDRPAGSLIALLGSSGWLEVAVVNGDASRHLTAGPGATVWLRRKS
jgi:S-adenosylmethionine hydrolase